MPAEHQWDRVSQTIAEWMDSMTERVTDELLDDGRAPFAARVTQSSLVDYYNDAFFLPNGEPNAKGRQKEIERLGVPGFVKAIRAVIAHRKREGLPVAATVAQGEPDVGGPVGAGVMEALVSTTAPAATQQ